MSRAMNLSALASALLAAAAAVAIPAPAAHADTVPGEAGLVPVLASAFDAAHRQAAVEGVALTITSGRRSYAQQQALWDEALARYGTAAEARRWVLPPDESTHVTGEAVDVGPWQGAQWLQDNGSRWGLCRVFVNEWWHFEAVGTPGAACPPMIADASLR